jgi:hypothetical protein
MVLRRDTLEAGSRWKPLLRVRPRIRTARAYAQHQPISGVGLLRRRSLPRHRPRRSRRATTLWCATVARPRINEERTTRQNDVPALLRRAQHDDQRHREPQAKTRKRRSMRVLRNAPAIREGLRRTPAQRRGVQGPASGRAVASKQSPSRLQSEEEPRASASLTPSGSEEPLTTPALHRIAKKRDPELPARRSPATRGHLHRVSQMHLSSSHDAEHSAERVLEKILCEKSGSGTPDAERHAQ